MAIDPDSRRRIEPVALDGGDDLGGVAAEDGSANRICSSSSIDISVHMGQLFGVIASSSRISSAGRLVSH